MKRGLLLLQSVASSALRLSGRAAPGRRWPAESAVRSSGQTGAALFVAAGVATGVVGAAAAGASTSSLAMCDDDDSDGRLRHAETSTAAVTNPPSIATSVAAAVAASSRGGPIEGKKNIDELDVAPAHDPRMPFPESSLRHDTYNGVTLDLTDVTTQQTPKFTDAEAFGAMLSEALSIWTAEQRKGIWLKVPARHSHLIAPATRLGFDFQHAEPGFCVLTKWLPLNSESRLPNMGTHQVGVGALVVHPATGKMLAVQERTGPAAKRKLWKMPTGLTDPGEDVSRAVVREVKEETGLDTVFDRIVCFRQAHGGLFGRSDMFFVCLCRLAPECEERIREGGGYDVELVPQEEEILMADWIDMEEYANQDVWRESPLYGEMNAAMIRAARRGVACSPSSDGATDSSKNDYVVGGGGDDEPHGFVAKNLPVGFRPGHNTIYVSSRL